MDHEEQPTFDNKDDEIEYWKNLADKFSDE